MKTQPRLHIHMPLGNVIRCARCYIYVDVSTLPPIQIINIQFRCNIQFRKGFEIGQSDIGHRISVYHYLSISIFIQICT